MADNKEKVIITDIKDVKKADVADKSAKAKSNLDSKGRAYATGKRKDAVARVWISKGKGNVTVNGVDAVAYFKRPTLNLLINQPFEVVDSVKGFDVVATVKGGGLSGQAGALKAGISKALVEFNPDNKPELRKAGFMTRDSRVVERKKYGRKKARKSPQFSKR